MKHYIETVVPGVYITKGNGVLWKSCDDKMTRVSCKSFKDKRKMRNMIYVEHKRKSN